MPQGSPVARDVVFILADGSFVVQWDDNRVQELLSGHYRNYDRGDFGHEITDYELSQLKAAGRVEHYTSNQVWLHDLPENDRVAAARNYAGSVRVRSYYLNTTLPESRLNEVQKRIEELGLEDDFVPRLRDDMVAILGKNGTAFRQLKDAERAQKQLTVKAPDVFKQTAIAFVETHYHEDNAPAQSYQNNSNWDAIQVAQDNEISSGKRALVLLGSAEERAAIGGLMQAMGMEVTLAETGLLGLQLLEDVNPDLLLMDVQLPDMHGWELLAKIKEIGTFARLPKIMIADHRSKSDDQAFALTVGKVDVYLVKPISMAQLRLNIWLTLKHALD